MEAEFWLSITLACLLGAMSPGLSLAVIVNISLSQGRLAGLIAATTHGVTIGLYAFLTASGLVAVLSRYEFAFDVLRIAGCLYLIWMALKLIFAKSDSSDDLVTDSSRSKWLAARDGFLIALVNPKIIIFFTALFSQFVSIDSQLWEKSLMALIAGGVDALWYMFMAVVISHSGSLIRYQQSARWLNKAFGFLLLLIVAGFIFQITIPGL